MLDTNTVISGQFWQGSPRRVLELVKAGRYQSLTSTEIEKEFIRVLAYPKFGLSPPEILPIVADYRAYSKKVNVSSKVEAVKHDLTDNIFLACAVDGNADYIISGDHHLLDLGSFQEIPIVTSKEFLQRESVISQ